MKVHLTSTLIVLFAVHAAADEEEETNRHAMTFSVSPGGISPIGPAELVVRNSGVSPDGLLWGAAELGLSATTFPSMNIDAASDGTDYIPCDGGTTCREILYETTVTPASMGQTGSHVDAEASSDGAASDVFGTVVRIDSGSEVITRYRTTDALGTTPDSDLDALVWGEEVEGVIYFSVDGPTAALLGVSPADILVGSSTGWFVWLTEAQLGLVPGDDVDALSVDIQHGCIGFSLAPLSTTLLLNPLWSAADILSSAGTGAVNGVHIAANKLGLKASDDVNGVRITDPWLKICRDSELKIGAFPYEALRINGTGGNVRHRVRATCGQPLTLSIAPLHPSSFGILLWTLGRPCDGQITYFAETNDYLVMNPALVVPSPILMLIPPGVFTTTVGTAQLPCPLTVTLQAAFSGPPQVHLSNAVTLRLH